MSARKKPAKRRVETPVDSEIRAAGERIGYTPTEPKRPDPELHAGLLTLTGKVSELLAMVELWEKNPEPEHCKITAIFEQLSELNLEIWRLRWDGSGLCDHVVAS